VNLRPACSPKKTNWHALAEGLKDAGKGVFQIIPRRWAMPDPNSH
jgi:hypothetical protein